MLRIKPLPVKTQILNGLSKNKELSSACRLRFVAPLVRAAGIENSQDEQVGIRKQQLFRLCPGRLGRTHQHTDMLALRKIAQMLLAYTGQSGNFIFGEHFLARLDFDHVLGPFASFDAVRILPDTQIPQQ
jgi:hypothetical protein